MNRSIIVCGTALIAIFATLNPAHAQSQSDAAPTGGDIVVTARRVQERLQDVPISISVFSAQQVADRNIVSAGELARYTPSLSANSRFGPEKTSFAIRGFNQDGGTAPSVGVYFADVPALRSTGSTTTGNGAGPGALFDLQNVQVLKGPQGTLFGRNTSGGAVLLVPAKPTDQLEGYVEGSLGNHEMRRVQAVLNVPITDSLRVRLGVDRQTRDGYIRNLSGIGPDKFNSVDYWAVRGSVVADITPDLENYFIGSWSRSDTPGFLPRVFACNRRIAATTPATTNSAVVNLECAQADRANSRDFFTGENAIPDPRQLVAQFQFINTTTWRASDSVTIKNIVSYGEIRESFRSSVDGEDLKIVSGPDAGKNAVRVFSNTYPGGDSASLSTLTEELQLQGTSLDHRLNWQGGGYMEIGNPLGYAGTLSTNTAVCTTASPLTGCGPFTPQAGVSPVASTLTGRLQEYRFRDYGLYAQGTFKLTEKLSFTGGFRYTWDKYSVIAEHMNFLPVPPVSSPARGFCADQFTFGARGTATNPGTLTIDQCRHTTNGKSSAPTWVVDLDYKPIEDILVYAKYARGYRQGQIRPEGYGREAFQPEKIDTYEIGAKTSWRGAVSGTFNVAAFYNDFSNQQVTASGVFRTPGLTPAQVIVNAGKSRIAGVEVDSSIRAFAGMQIDFGYAYLDTKVKSLIAPPADAVFSTILISGALVGYPLTNAPKHKVTLTGTYTLPIDQSIGRISLGATYTYSSKQYSTYQDSTPQIIAAVGRDLGLLPAISLLNLNLNWRSIAGKPIDLALFATNVTNKKYPVAVFGLYPTFGEEAMAVGEPRMFGIRLRYRFRN